MANDKKSPSEEGADAVGSETSNGSVPDKITTLPTTSYNPDDLTEFLNTVFHTELEEGEEILLWSANRTPGFPVDEDAMLKKLARLKKHQAFYYGTSTCRRAEDGRLYNRKSLFCRLHSVVLDDVGTKVDLDKLEGITPTYIIESSEGNQQWGFVLATPIDDLEVAQVFVSLVYNSGFTDEGGNMPTKLVRLPLGYNMKSGKEDMPVKLVSSDGPLWAPDDLLLALDTGVRWEDILEDAELVRKKHLSVVQGAAAWSPVHAELPTHDGIIDPALEWLYERNWVYQERDEWIDIRCPWADEHTEKGPPHDRAGYSPLGAGGDTYRKSRGFHCFHDSCSHRGAADFLEYVAAHGGPELPMFDYVPELLSTYVYDAAGDQVWDVKEQSYDPKPISISGFRNLFARKIRYVNFQGNLKEVSPVSLYMVNPSRVVVSGVEYNPAERGRIFEGDDGGIKLNLFRMKRYHDTPIDEAAIAPFYDYLEYLMPHQDEREMFIDWLACKVQDPAFRGPAMFMVAERQGTGRNTLMDIVGQMFGQRHMKHVPFHRLIGQTAYNDYQESLFVVVDETLAVEDYTSNRRAGDILKEIIDPRPTLATINPKYGRQRTVWSVASYIFLSNHFDGLKLTENDRRYYAIRNAYEPAPPAYFGQINRWINAGGWEEHLWNDLLYREVDIEKMNAPPESSATMLEVIQQARSPIEMVMEAFIELWPTDFVPQKLFKDILPLVAADTLHLPDNPALILRRAWKASSAPSAGGYGDPMTVRGTQYRFGIKRGCMYPAKPGNSVWEDTREAIDRYNQTEMVAAVIARLEEQGIDF